MTKETLNWMFSGGLCIQASGAMWDGFETSNCGVFEVSQWSYNYGQLIGALAWMHEAVSFFFFFFLALSGFDQNILKLTISLFI